MNTYKHHLLFLTKFLRDGRAIASAWPSSKSLSRATIARVDFDRADVIVELGAGTGPITSMIMRHLRPHTRLVIIERDTDFVKILTERFAGEANVDVVHADVRDLDAILVERGITTVDYFISGLPVPSLPRDVRDKMLAAVRKFLHPGGSFSNITEIPLLYWPFYKKVFKQVSFKFVPVNIPPGGVYYCSGVR